jgi:hypothetical protein
MDKTELVQEFEKLAERLNSVITGFETFMHDYDNNMKTLNKIASTTNSNVKLMNKVATESNDYGTLSQLPNQSMNPLLDFILS